jgi:hypothetical protein
LLWPELLSDRRRLLSILSGCCGKLVDYGTIASGFRVLRNSTFLRWVVTASKEAWNEFHYGQGWPNLVGKQNAIESDAAKLAVYRRRHR